MFSLFTRATLPVAIVLVSVLLHLGMLGMIVLAERRGPTTAENNAIEVELVQAADVPEPPKPEPIKPEPPKLEPPKLEPPKLEPPKAELPKPEPPKAEAAKPEPQKPVEQKPQPAPAAPPPEAPPGQTAKAPEPDQPPMPPEKPATPDAPSGGPGEGRAKLTPEEIAAFRAQVQRCWTLPVGVPDAMKLEAVLRVRLARNGALTTSPELLKANASAGGPILVGIAMKALSECGPYRTLPAAKYNEWQVLDLRFLATGLAGLGGGKPPAKPGPAG